MNPELLQDRIHRGLNAAARAIGADTDAYRPTASSDPLAPINRYLRLRAAFSAHDGSFAHPSGYGEALWHGVFDAAYTKPGDYLVQKNLAWFIAAQQRLLPVLCINTNRVVSFSRPSAPSDMGVNSYGGVTTATTIPVLTNWPASVLGATGRGHSQTDLPSDNSVPYWIVLLPALPNIMLQPSDLMSDDLGRNAVVAAAELTELGWRLAVRQATT